MSSTKSKRPASEPAFLAVRINSSLRNRPSRRLFRLAGEIELRGQDASALRRDLHVEVARAALVDARHDGAEDGSAPPHRRTGGRAGGSRNCRTRPCRPPARDRPARPPPACSRASARSRPARSADPPMPGSISSARSGEDGLKNGPSVWRKVVASPSWHSGVGLSGAWARLVSSVSSEPAANAPVASSVRRVGKLLVMSYLLGTSSRRPDHCLDA